jgi:formamidopyrimidine-DNA glycosylase
VPELPEVEVTRRHLAPVLEGSRVASVMVLRERMLRRQPRVRDFADRLTGRRVEALDRHGKLLLARLDGDLIWLLHLGMSGRLAVASGREEHPHTRLTVRLRDGREVRFVDPRTFGFTVVLTPAELAAGGWLPRGPDALEELPSAPDLASRLAGRRAPIKALLLDQHLLAGLGNIYADEVLHRAGVRPDRTAGSLDPGEVAALRDAVGPVLREGLQHGGTSLDDLAYLLPDGRAGGYLALLRAYGRTGEPCPRCGTPIVRTVLRNRSAHYCPGCQR